VGEGGVHRPRGRMAASSSGRAPWRCEVEGESKVEGARRSWGRTGKETKKAHDNCGASWVENVKQASKQAAHLRAMGKAMAIGVN
jgi:hypothetical protein